MLPLLPLRRPRHGSVTGRLRARYGTARATVARRRLRHCTHVGMAAAATGCDGHARRCGALRACASASSLSALRAFAVYPCYMRGTAPQQSLAQMLRTAAGGT
eukprot:TRINITY_DN1524_c1_g2_i1.p4 TRINITY_DN1524_c1_g2~~TRINITY_DN1524_c1_g2_i1.p4  ORF type:complete len:103 (-),score=17.25 TRINITY_DN1524_c1_g2_i1:416-724(-)